MESNEVLTLRAMAWQRAKGELHAMLATYWPIIGVAGAGSERRVLSTEHDVRERVREFIADVEENL